MSIVSNREFVRHKYVDASNFSSEPQHVVGSEHRIDEIVGEALLSDLSILIDVFEIVANRIIDIDALESSDDEVVACRFSYVGNSVL